MYRLFQPTRVHVCFMYNCCNCSFLSSKKNQMVHGREGELSLQLQKVSLLRESWMWKAPCTLRMVVWCVETVPGCSSALNANTKSVTSTMPPSLQPMRTYIASAVTPRTTLLGSWLSPLDFSPHSLLCPQILNPDSSATL